VGFGLQPFQSEYAVARAQRCASIPTVAQREAAAPSAASLSPGVSD
jgi:hypothetical protein